MSKKMQSRPFKRKATAANMNAQGYLCAAETNKLITLVAQGRFAEAENLARKMTESFPRYGLGWKMLGAALYLRGNIAESLGPMKKAAMLSPLDAEAHGNLGNILMNLGRLDEAQASCRRALEIKPDFAEAHGNLGNILKDLDRLEEAQASYRRALEIKPNFANALFNLGITLMNLGRPEEAHASYRRVLEIKPDFAEAHGNLGNILKDLDRPEEAEASYRRALEIEPNFADAHNNLGNILKELGRPDEAEASYRRALEIKPDFAEAHGNLGNFLKELGRLDEAQAHCRRALEINPNFAEAHNNLGDTLRNLVRREEAQAHCRRALEIKPNFAEAYNNLGIILMELGRLDEAEASYRRALEIKPNFAEAHNNLGNILKDLGSLDEAEASYRRALEIKPDFAEAHSNLLYAMIYAACPHSIYLEEAREYGRIAAQKAGGRITAWPCAHTRPKRLRVGVVSGDLRNHPVGFFLENVFAQIDPARIELIAYPTNYTADELTGRIKPYFSAWKLLVGLSDEAAAHLIHADGIHLLLDLSGHTAKNRLPVFAWKPAPVQASWLGHSASTGLAEMDYLLGDPYVTPPGEEGHFTETVWRMPETLYCFSPPRFSPEVRPLPALSCGYITFGCFNNLTKMNDSVVKLWAKVLQAIPSSRLFLKSRQLNTISIQEATRERFAAYGISPGRVLLEGSSPRAEYLDAYNRIDIALDPFPYHGVTTSIEGLWMGVPMITRRGDCFLSHVGESLANNAGLAEWIAADDQDYVAKALAHATNLARLAALRGALRQRAQASPLFDAPRFARHFEAALWGMWEASRRGIHL